MSQQIRTKFSVILARIRTRIADWLTWAESKVIPVLPDVDPPHLQADQDVLLKGRGFIVDGGWFDGGGRVSTKKVRTLEVVCRSRLTLDIVGQAEYFLFHSTYGHYDFEHSVFDAVAGFIPVVSADDENALVTEPIEPQRGADITSRRGGRQQSKITDWAESSLFFQVSYLADLDQTVKY